MHKRKLLFFDIDGTIWDRYNTIPDSTREAIHLVREAGHLTFINTGRTRAYVTNPKLFDLGFDGIVSGCGTMIELHGEVLFYKELPASLVGKSLKVIRKYGIWPILEGRDYIYMDHEDFGRDEYGRKVMKEVGDKLRPVTNPLEDWAVSKISCFSPTIDMSACMDELKEDFDFLVHNASIAEFVPHGFHKGAGIQRLCQLLQADIQDTFAFGDSVNDLGMLQTAGTAVVMGNGSEAAKACADFITAALHDDGIYKACKHFELFSI